MSNDQLLNLQPGVVVHGRYEVVKCLGTGSMGMVYLCRDLELGNMMVAMKVLFGEVARDEISATRFRNEIVASYGVNHPNVVRAFEYFKAGDLVAYTMEHVGGGDLADQLNNEELPPFEDIIRILSQICLGVQAIHAAGIIHRDLKPENILLSTNGDVKITDFGIARMGGGPRLTEHGGVVGTIDYVSTEYLEHGTVDEKSDIYAIGVIAYEIITHEAPFKGRSVVETMQMRLRNDPPSPKIVRTDTPEELAQIVIKAMARKPEQRYQTSQEMYDDIQELKFNLKKEKQKPAVSVGADLYLEPKSNFSNNNSGNISSGNTLRTFLDSQNKWSELDPIGRSRENDAVPNITVSDSKLNTSRVRELSDSESINSEKALVWELLPWILIFFIGFGVGLMILSQYKKYLDSSEVTASLNQTSVVDFLKS